MVLIFIPVILLLLTSLSRVGMAAVVFSFVNAFSLIISQLTGAGIGEIFVGTAAYWAFLVTFMGQSQSTNIEDYINY